MLPRSRGPTRPSRALLWFSSLAILSALSSGTACSDCDGTMIDGRCRPKCADADCPNGGRCFDGLCSDPCGSDADCSGGGECLRVQTENDFVGRLCIGGEPKEPTRIGAGCDENADCDVASGVHCIDTKCTLICRSHEECGSAGACTATATDADGGSVHLCEADDAPRDPGQYGTMCPYGDECDGDGGYRCVGAGPGDIDAYCAGPCQGDADCPVGHFCAEEISGAVPCTNICGFDGEPTETCIEDARIGPGQPYGCGVNWLTTRICLLREFCNACETDADCLGQPNRICARDASGNKICTVRCDPSFDSCPWGTATECRMWDDERGFATCSHRFGACQGTGQSCEPCVDQRDCPSGFCTETQFSGEKYCVDFSAECACPADTTLTCTGGGCPSAPSGAVMTCYGGSEFVGGLAENACIGAAPLRDEAAPDSCWP